MEALSAYGELKAGGAPGALLKTEGVGLRIAFVQYSLVQHLIIGEPVLQKEANMHAKVDPLPASNDRPPHGARESTRPIRALSRGLEVLTVLNRLERAAINTLANAVALPRTTTFRILETLRLAGYVERDPHDDRYRPTIMVRALSEGFDDEAMLAHIAKPHLAALGAQIVWPVAIATPAGAAMLIRETTDYQSPLALEKHGPGIRVPMLTSAAGRAFLAFCSAAQRDTLLELLGRSTLPEDRLARDRPEVDRVLQETRAQGFGMAQRARRISEETSLAIPMRRQRQERILATISVRFAATAVPLRTAIEQFLPKMREVALKIEAEFG
jgi:IclR family transcriptional regulator, mhp operon transcriptional activator